MSWNDILTIIKKTYFYTQKGMNFHLEAFMLYLNLCLEGQATIPQRKEILAKKRKSLLRSIEELQNCIEYVDWKQNFYDDVLSGKRPYVSNLIPVQE